MRILVHMFSTSNILNYSRLAEKINRAYCEKHGYDFIHNIYDNIEYNFASLEKIASFNTYLNSAKYDYIMIS